MFDYAVFTEKAQAICETGRFLFQQGWCPATSSNFSCRIDAEHVAITVSGVHKGELQVGDIMCVDLQGQAVGSSKKPSAETLLHTVLYQRDEGIGAVLHTHSVNATVLSRLFAKEEKIYMEDYEVLKALPGISTHETQTVLPIFPNTQDMPYLSKATMAWLDEHPQTHGYCIAGHGFYTWGENLADARRHIEAFEFLFECEILQLKLRTAISA